MIDLRLPLPQSPEYARTCDLLGLPVRACKTERGDEVVAWWQVQSRRLGPLGRVDMISRGPVARDPDTLGDWLDRWTWRHDGRPLLLNADGLDAGALRGAGFWPLFTPASVALLPLGPVAGMRAGLHQKWRNRLVRAERAGLSVRRLPLDPGHWVLAAEADMARSRRYRGLPPGFSAAFGRANPGRALVWEVRDGKTPLAAVVVLRHGRMCTWQIGQTTPRGRQVNAMNLALWTAMEWLAAHGHDTLDLGTVNTEDAPGLARFKLGTGARLHRLAGTWLHLGLLAPVARRLPARLAA